VFCVFFYLTSQKPLPFIEGPFVTFVSWVGCASEVQFSVIDCNIAKEK